MTGLVYFLTRYLIYFICFLHNLENINHLLKDSETGKIVISAYGIVGIVLASVVLLASVIFGIWWSKFRMAAYRILPAADNQELQPLAGGNNDDDPGNNPDNNPGNNDDNPGNNDDNPGNNDDNLAPERKI